MNVLGILLLALGVQTAHAPPRDAAPEPATGAAIIRGRVTDAETGTPLARVDVSLTQVGTREQMDTVSGADGAFEFTRLRGGKYSLQADPTARVTTHRPASFRAPDQKTDSTIVIRDGQVFENAVIALPRGFVITARVLDEDGGPVADALVKAEAIEARGSFSTRSRMTDDLGGVRLWGYSPGLYRVCATPRSLELDRRSSEGYIETCYPSVSVSDAQPVVITSTDPPEVQIRLRRTRLFQITGVVVDANGQPAPRAVVSLVTVEREGVAGRTIQNVGGTFTARGLPPGEYSVAAQAPYDANPDDAARPIGIVPLQLQTSDADGVVVVLSRPVTVRGRIVFEGGPPPPLAGFRVQGSPARRMFTGARRSPEARVNADLSFELVGMFGQRTIDVVAPPEWVLKSVRYRGRELINVPTEFKSDGDAAALEVVLTNRPAALFARVQGTPEPDNVRVLLFPADANQWNSAGQPSIWRMGVWKEGSYAFARLRPAEYFVAIVPEGMPFTDGDPRMFEELSKTAERITLLENDQRTIELRK